ncbi:hypothetical protein M9Y10_024746 [Tritrichomonas musculus]|uniref:Uncharacterized protein n=1 Tax=Tritrichomonas musculus TaxID=1915356 RepID=A0ABR2HB46_9EUKA
MNTTYTLSLKSSKFTIPSDFLSITNVDPSIFEDLSKTHNYTIKSNVHEEIIEQFIDFWVYRKVPKISQENISEYEEISNEFQIMRNLIQVFKRKQENKSQFQKKKNSLELKLKEKKEKYLHIIDLLFDYNKPLYQKYQLYGACTSEDAKYLSYLTGIEVVIDGIDYFLNIKEQTAAISNRNIIHKNEINIPRSITHEGKTYIVKDTFISALQVSKISTLSFPEDSEVRTFNKDFIANTGITTLYIPASVVELKTGWCWCTDYLNNIYLSPKSKNFAYIENTFLVGKSDKKSDVFDLLFFVRRDVRHVTIPSYIKTIMPYAFNKCMSLETITFHSDSELKEIKYFAFYECSIKSIIIPQHVIKIREGAFVKCRKLFSIIFHQNSELQYLSKRVLEATKVQRIAIPEKVNTIHKYFFDNTSLIHVNLSPNNVNFSCIENKYIIGKSNPQSNTFDCIIFANRDIESITIPSFIKHIYPGAFQNCDQLKSVQFADNSELETIEDDSFRNSSIEEIKIPKSVTHIFKRVFSNCSKLKKIEFEENSNLILIDQEAFYESGIESICIPKHVKKILFYAFYGCKQLKEIVFHEDSELELIGFGAFKQASISRIRIPKHVKTIKSSIFAKCEKLKKVDFQGNSELQKIDENVFDSTSIEEISIPQNVNEIGNYSFFNCKKLKTVNFHPDSKLKVINFGAFSSSSICSIDIPRNVEEIGENAFMNCNNLRIVNFHDDSHLKTIKNSAFESTAITSIIIPDSVTEIDHNPFWSCEKLRIIELSGQLANELINKCTILDDTKQYLFSHEKNNI